MSYTGHSRRGGRGGGHRGRGAGFWADPSYAGQPAPDEKLLALRQSVIATFAAARQVAREGSPEKAAKATELLNATRRELYKLLAGEPE